MAGIPVPAKASEVIGTIKIERNASSPTQMTLPSWKVHPSPIFSSGVMAFEHLKKAGYPLFCDLAAWRQNIF